MLRVLISAALLSFAATGQSPTTVFQPGGTGAVAARFGDGGRWVASVPDSPLPGDSSPVSIFAVSTGHLVRTIADERHKRIVHVATDPLHDRLALALEGAEVAMMDVTSGAQIWRAAAPDTLKNSQAAVSDLRFSPDGERVCAVIAITPQVRFRMPKTQFSWHAWEAASGKVLESRPLTVAGLPEYGSTATISDDCLSVAMVSAMKSVIVDPKTDKPLGRELAGRITAFHMTARRAWVFRAAKNIPVATRLVNLDTDVDVPSEIPMFSAGTFSPDGKTLVVLGTEIGWRVIDAESGSVRFPGNGTLPYSSGQVSFTPDGARFLVSTVAGPVIVDLKDPMQYRALLTPAGGAVPREPLIKAGDYSPGAMTSARQEEIKSAAERSLKQIGGGGLMPAGAFSKDGRWLITRSADSALDFYDTATGNRIPFRVANEPDVNERKFPPLSVAAEGRYLYVRTEVKQVQNLVNRKVPHPGTFAPNRTAVVESTVEQGAFSTKVVDMLTGQVKATEFRGVTCISAGGEYAVESTTDPRGKVILTLRSADGLAEDLSAAAAEFEEGCSISHSGMYAVVAKTDKRYQGSGAQWMPEELRNYGDRFGMRKVELHVYDIRARRIIATLQGEDSKPAKLPFSPSSVKWTHDDRFLLGGGGGVNVIDKHGVVRVFEAATGRQVHAVADTEQSVPLELGPDCSILITAPGNVRNLISEAFGVEVREAASGRILFELPDAVAEADALTFSPNGKTILGPDRSHALAIWRRTDGKQLGQFRPLQQGEWLVQAASGLFDGTRQAWPMLSWRDNDNALDVAAPEIYFNEFYRPGLLADLIEGREPPAPLKLAQLDRRQPKVTLAVNANGETAMLRISASEAPADASHARGSGLKDLRLFRNGQLIRAWRGDLPLDSQGTAAFEVTVPAIAGENRFTAYAFNGDNIKSGDGTAVLRRAGTPGIGKAYVLSIGINRYANSEFNLRFATADAKTIAAEFMGKQLDLNQFSAVEPIQLLDEAATAANIKLAFGRFSGEATGSLPPDAPEILSRIRPLRPEDTLIVFFAGHGIASGDRFYLVPHDLGYLGPKAKVSANLSAIFDHGISDQYLEQALVPIDAGHILLIIDACQSGQALEAEEARRGPMNSRGLAQLAWEKGISILAASQADQSAMEIDELKHGYLTFALLEGLQKPVADSAPADGLTSETEWLEYASRRVPQLQIEAFDHTAKEPNRVLKPEIVVDTPAALQSPRLFTPRDASGTPLIVAKFK